MREVRSAISWADRFTIRITTLSSSREIGKRLFRRNLVQVITGQAMQE